MIWPKGQNRGTLIPLISAETGMVGYPSSTQNGVAVRVLYNPAMNIGQRVKAEAS